MLHMYMNKETMSVYLKCIKLYILQNFRKEIRNIKMCCININLTLNPFVLTNTAS